MDFFSDRENGPTPRTKESIPQEVWNGIVVVFETLVTTGAFGKKFPEMCPDVGVNATIGTNVDNLRIDLQARIPRIGWPTTYSFKGSWGQQEIPDPQKLLAIMDLLEFCHRSIGKPIDLYYHSGYRHQHLNFQAEEGQHEFRESINELFSRNGIAFHLSDEGKIERLGPSVLRELLAATQFSTGDATLDRMIEQSKVKFSSPDIAVRKEALDTLWDCFERLKTIDGPDKKKSIEARIARQCPGENFPERITSECREMREIGNNFHIRHAEVGKEQLCSPRQIDYLYHRLYCLINLLLQRD